MNKKVKFYKILTFICATLLIVSCSDDDYSVPGGRSGSDLQNDCIKRSLGPNIVGNQIEFAYAMALPKEKGLLAEAWVEASIAGASGTYFDNKSYHTNAGGNDVGVVVGTPSVTDGKITTLTYTADTCAATLRYHYVIPEEARGKNVSFTFFAKDTKGKIVSYKMGGYAISAMDLKLDIVIPNDSYFSIADMKSYTATEIASNPEKADIIYLYRRITGINFLHSFVAPSADAEYRPDITLPVGVNNKTPFLRTYSAIDQQLARDQYGVFIDDLDLQKIDLSNSPDFAINLKKDAGVWVESADGQYRAFLYVNAVNNTRREITVSMKRLKVK